MLRNIIAPTLVTLSLLLGAGTTAAAGDASKAPSANWDEVKTWSHDKKKDAVESGQQAMAASKGKLRELQLASRQSVGETKAAHLENMKDLKAKMAAASVQLAAARRSGAKTWDSTRESFTSAFKDLTTSHEKASATK